MSQAANDHKILTYDKKAREALLTGATKMYKAVTKTYGPKGENVILEKVYGQPIVTRDGVTVAREVYSKVRDENAAMRLMREAADATNTVAGDGTTATIALTYHLLRRALEQGTNFMQVRDQFKADAELLQTTLDKITKDVKKGQLTQVATVSCGDKALGQLIAEAVEQVGADGGIVTERAHVADVEREYVEGYFVQKGFTAITAGKRELVSPVIIAVNNKISNNADILGLLQKLATILQINPKNGEKLKFVIFGNVEGEAYQTLVANVIRGTIDAVAVPTPEGGDLGTQYLEDIATYTGGKVITDGNFDMSFLGSADKVVCSQYQCSVFGGKFKEEDYKKRLLDLKDRLEAEEFDNVAEKLRDRLSKLSGKVAIFRIGGATESEKEEKEFRVEDAIQASRAAYSTGVVPGGGTTLVRLAQTEGLSPMFKGALEDTFKKLLQNADLPAEVKLNELLQTKAPMGYNLRKGDELVNLEDEGILDPSLVVGEVIRNAASIAGNLVTAGAIVVFEDAPEK